MKFIKQFGIILAISFIGEIMNYLIPLPVPASIYGLVLMLLCLHFGIVHIDSVKDSGKFLIEIMPLMFNPTAAGMNKSGMISMRNLTESITEPICTNPKCRQKKNRTTP